MVVGNEVEPSSLALPNVHNTSMTVLCREAIHSLNALSDARAYSTRRKPRLRGETVAWQIPCGSANSPTKILPHAAEISYVSVARRTLIAAQDLTALLLAAADNSLFLSASKVFGSLQSLLCLQRKAATMMCRRCRPSRRKLCLLWRGDAPLARPST